MYPFAGRTCWHCQQGSIVTDDAKQYCNACGAIVAIAPQNTPFASLRPGEEFFSSYVPDGPMWRRALAWEQLPPDCNAYSLGTQTIYASFNPTSPCLRAEERKILGTQFSYN